MKTILVATFALTTATSLFAQGTVIFNNRNTLGTSHVYAPLPGNMDSYQIGNGPNDGPSGTTDWTGYTPIGASGLTGKYGAATTFAQILAANGANQPESSLTPQGSIATFRTGAGAGFIAQIVSTLSNVPKDAPVATLEVVAWDNSSGLYSTYALAYNAWYYSGLPMGWSGTFNLFAIGGDVNTPPDLVFPSFNLYSIVGPEPSAPTVAALGAAVLWIMRRRKKSVLNRQILR